ncbi:MAG: tetratricopeptide repeat protein [Candidatus Heimdallarchaeota archaeon]
MSKMSGFEEQFENYAHQGKFHDLVRVLEQKIASADSSNEKLNLQIQLAEAHYQAREFQKSRRIAQELLEKGEEQNDHLLVGNVENLLGKIYRIHQQYSEAIDHYQRAEQAFAQVGNNEGLSKVYHNLGNVHIFLERFKQAKKYHFKAYELAQKDPNQEILASSLLNIGSMFYQNGELEEALSYFEKACTLLEEIPDEPNLAATYHNLAEVFLLRSKYENASAYSSKALTLYKKHENVIGQRLALTTYARSTKSAGHFDKSIEAYLSIIDLKGAGNPEKVLHELGETYIALNQLNDAKKVFEQILETPTRTPPDEVQALDRLARIAITERNLEQAIKRYEQILNILNELEPQDHDSIASTEANLGYAYLKIDKMDRAWELLERATRYFQKRKNWEELAILANNFKDELILKRHYNLAIPLLEEYSIPSLKKLKNSEGENQHHYEVAFLHHLQGNTQQGLTYWRKNHNKKAAYPNESARFLNNPFFDDQTKKELARLHFDFLTQLRPRSGKTTNIKEL